MKDQTTKVIYQNSLQQPGAVDGFILEGEAKIAVTGEGLLMENALDSGLGQKANYVLWCDRIFPADIEVSWEFKPLTKKGLCILFFCAAGRQGEDLFAGELAPRTGEYQQYHSGDINAYHVSYYRRKEPDELAFHTCNLRKSHGFHLVAQGADPLPDAPDAAGFYRIKMRKKGGQIRFFVNDLCVFTYDDDGQTHGPVLPGGRLGFRQLAPLKAVYRNLEVKEIG